jgi:hypothetical protein
VWQVDGALPWETSEATPGIADLISNIKRLSEQVWSQGHDLQSRLVLNFSNMLIAAGMKLKARYQLETVSASSNVQ